MLTLRRAATILPLVALATLAILLGESLAKTNTNEQEHQPPAPSVVILSHRKPLAPSSPMNLLHGSRMVKSPKMALSLPPTVFRHSIRYAIFINGPGGCSCGRCPGHPDRWSSIRRLFSIWTSTTFLSRINRTPRSDYSSVGGNSCKRVARVRPGS